jgi:hypothetical protein
MSHTLYAQVGERASLGPQAAHDERAARDPALGGSVLDRLPFKARRCDERFLLGRDRAGYRRRLSAARPGARQGGRCAGWRMSARGWPKRRSVGSCERRRSTCAGGWGLSAPAASRARARRCERGRGSIHGRVWSRSLMFPSGAAQKLPDRCPKSCQSLPKRQPARDSARPGRRGRYRSARWRGYLRRRKSPKSGAVYA